MAWLKAVVAIVCLAGAARFGVRALASRRADRPGQLAIAALLAAAATLVLRW